MPSAYEILQALGLLGPEADLNPGRMEPPFRPYAAPPQEDFTYPERNPAPMLPPPGRGQRFLENFSGNVLTMPRLAARPGASSMDQFLLALAQGGLGGFARGTLRSASEREGFNERATVEQRRLSEAAAVLARQRHQVRLAGIKEGAKPRPLPKPPLKTLAERKTEAFELGKARQEGARAGGRGAPRPAAGKPGAKKALDYTPLHRRAIAQTKGEYNRLLYFDPQETKAETKAAHERALDAVQAGVIDMAARADSADVGRIRTTIASWPGLETRPAVIKAVSELKARVAGGK